MGRKKKIIIGVIDRKTCSRCGETKHIVFFTKQTGKEYYKNKCNSCRYKYWVAIRDNDKHKEGTIRYEKARSKEGHPSYHKYVCRREFHKALASGLITKQPCSACGDIKAEGHHPDYSKPLDVVWLCRKHHTEEYKNQRIKQFV